MAQQQRTSFWKFLFGAAVMWCLPVIIFVVDEKVFPHIFVYTLGGLVICIPAALIVHKQRNINGSNFDKLLPMLPILIPFWLVAAYPFTLKNILVSFAFVIVGFVLPFVSKYLTWWFYTLGGKVPLPQTHNWLIDKQNKKNPGKKYQDFLKVSTGFGVAVGMLSVMFSNSGNYESMIIFMQFLSIFIIFSMGLTFGAEVRKKQLGG